MVRFSAGKEVRWNIFEFFGPVGKVGQLRLVGELVPMFAAEGPRLVGPGWP